MAGSSLLLCLSGGVEETSASLRCGVVSRSSSLYITGFNRLGLKTHLLITSSKSLLFPLPALDANVLELLLCMLAV